MGHCFLPFPQSSYDNTVVQLRKYKLCTVLSIWRTLQSVNDFCGRLFSSVASNLHLMLIFCKYEMFMMVRCHLSVILFIQFFQLSPRLFERRARYWSFRNINREWCYSPTIEITSHKSTVLTTSGMVPANICAFLYAFFVRFLKTTEYDRLNTRSNVAADPICRFHLIDTCHGKEDIVMDTNIFHDTEFFISVNMMFCCRCKQW